MIQIGPNFQKIFNKKYAKFKNPSLEKILQQAAYI